MNLCSNCTKSWNHTHQNMNSYTLTRTFDLACNEEDVKHEPSHRPAQVEKKLSFINMQKQTIDKNLLRQKIHKRKNAENLEKTIPQLETAKNQSG